MNEEERMGPHEGQPLRQAGEPLESAAGAMVMVHGRGATADSILTLSAELDRAGFAFLAPQARGNTWYPNSFLAPIESNEPGITSGMRAIEEALERIAAAEIPLERTILLGFSQGACLALEYAARHARRYGGVTGLSGGLIGPDGTPRDYPGSLDGTPVFLGCSDVDFHIPEERVVHTAGVLEGLDADVTMRIYPGMGHTVNLDEIEHVRSMMDAVAGG
jgi:phospholipase/carboxylesterase